MLPVIVIILIVALAFTILGSFILWITGLLVAVIFFAVPVGLMYALHKMDRLDLKEHPLLLVFPPVMFFVGLGLDHSGLLSIQPMSLSDPITGSPFAFVSFIIIICLLIVDIMVGRE